MNPVQHTIGALLAVVAARLVACGVDKELRERAVAEAELVPCACQLVPCACSREQGVRSEVSPTGLRVRGFECSDLFLL